MVHRQVDKAGCFLHGQAADLAEEPFGREKFMVPSECSETLSPDRPSWRYSIVVPFSARIDRRARYQDFDTSSLVGTSFGHVRKKV